ncbi:MAG: hypothetical protein LBU35_00285, partial [Holosporales bacterium]|nr:hypothetical protein [Holosporales bacterium]
MELSQKNVTIDNAILQDFDILKTTMQATSFINETFSRLSIADLRSSTGMRSLSDTDNEDQYRRSRTTILNTVPTLVNKRTQLKREIQSLISRIAETTKAIFGLTEAASFTGTTFSKKMALKRITRPLDCFAADIMRSGNPGWQGNQSAFIRSLLFDPMNHYAKTWDGCAPYGSEPLASNDRGGAVNSLFKGLFFQMGFYQTNVRNLEEIINKKSEIYVIESVLAEFFSILDYHGDNTDGIITTEEKLNICAQHPTTIGVTVEFNPYDTSDNSRLYRSLLEITKTAKSWRNQPLLTYADGTNIGILAKTMKAMRLLDINFGQALKLICSGLEVRDRNGYVEFVGGTPDLERINAPIRDMYQRMQERYKGGIDRFATFIQRRYQGSKNAVPIIDGNPYKLIDGICFYDSHVAPKVKLLTASNGTKIIMDNAGFIRAIFKDHIPITHCTLVEDEIINMSRQVSMPLLAAVLSEGTMSVAYNVSGLGTNFSNAAAARVSDGRGGNRAVAEYVPQDMALGNALQGAVSGDAAAGAAVKVLRALSR